MPTFRNILLDVDATAAGHPAFRQACDLAARSGARLKVVDGMEDVPDAARGHISSKMEQELIEHRLELLAALASSRPDVEIETAVLRGKPAIRLIQEVLRDDHDLVIRSHGRDLVPSRTFGPVDIELLRKCPCPVWLVGPQDRSEPGHILAAVDAESDAPDAQEFNRTILELALDIAEAEGATVTALHVWILFGQRMLKSRVPEQEYAQSLERSRIAADDALNRVVNALGARAANVRRECLNGNPTTVIPEFATTEHVDLVVMGTVGRTGIAGFLMGNTAEAILRELKGSVIAVKPPGFQTPVNGERLHEVVHRTDLNRHTRPRENQG